MKQEHWWDNLLWILIFLFVVPSSLVVASWNSLPGSRLYKVKLLAEDALVALTPSKGGKSELQVAYADKRLADATQMLVQSESADGLEYFRKQMEDAKIALAETPDGSAKEELKAKYLAALQNASHQLEQQKQIISTAHNIPIPTRQINNVNPVKQREMVVVREVTKVNYVTQVNEVTQVTHVTQVIQQIDQTQNQISQIMQQVQQQAAQQVADTTPIPTVAVATATPIPTVTPVETPPIDTVSPTQAAASPNSFSAMSGPSENGNSGNDNKNNDHGDNNGNNNGNGGNSN